MIRNVILLATFMVCVISSAFAQTAAVSLNAENSSVQDTWRGATSMRLSLSQRVAFRVYTLDAPARLVIDLQDVAWNGPDVPRLFEETEAVTHARFGIIELGWSRLVADLAQPFLPHNIQMETLPTGGAQLSMTLTSTTADVFAQAAGAPASARWSTSINTFPHQSSGDERFTVMLDPGHGGIDPGAERQGVSEKALMLTFALELREKLKASTDINVVLTRDTDRFVSLQSRVAQAHKAGADLFLSLHADALSQGGAKGATVYTLSQEASDAASAQLAARHNRADVLAGIDLTGSDDEVTRVLLDLARQETEPRSKAYAQTLVNALSSAGGPVNNRPLRSAGFTVLKSADIPSVLLEVGFLSSARDLENLRNPEWRDGIANAIVQSIEVWRDADAERRSRLRQ